MSGSRRGTARRAPAFFLTLVLLALLPLPAPAAENQASLVVEYGLDSLERRFFHPSFRFDFPWRGGGFFAQVEYISRMNGDLQGAIDYWVDAGLRRTLSGALDLELRLNHFCRHETLRDTLYVWNLNELLGRVIRTRGETTFSLGGGAFIGGSEGYRSLVTAGAEWRRFLLPELTLAAELKLVDFGRLYHQAGFALALNRSLELFFRNERRYALRNASYIGLRLRSRQTDDPLLEAMKVLVGASPFDDRFKLEVEGEFRMEFFRGESRRVVAAVGFETPILNGDGFFAQFWPGRMSYDVGLDYERALEPGLFAAWVARYRLDKPVDEERPFAASLFTGLALRNQRVFDELERDLRFDIAAGCDFKHGLELRSDLGVGICRSKAVNVFAEMRSRAGARRLRLDVRLLAALGRARELRPYVGWKKDFDPDPDRMAPGKLLFGLGFFKKF
jgi:hypothetical protein